MAREGQGEPAEAKARGGTSLNKVCLLSLYSRSPGEQGDSEEVVGAHRTHSKAQGAAGSQGGVIVDISNAESVVTQNIIY
jgi:hypothetical protein